MNARRFAAGLLLALAVPAALAAPARPIDVPKIAFTERVLPNGLSFIAVRSDASPTVSVQVWYHVGARDDPQGRSGFAHLFEHLMFKSTKYLQAEQFDRLTEDVGGSNNAFTSDDVTAYHEVVPSNHLETLLWAEAERMSNLNVDEANFKSERSVVEEEYRQRILASPYGRFFNAIAPSSYVKHPYRRPSIGNIDDLEAATLPDVAAFHSRYYRPDNATLVVAGDFDPKQLDAWVDKYFGQVQRPAKPLERDSSDEPAWKSDRTVAVTGPQVPLPAVAVTWLAPTVTSPDAAALRIASALLASGESSRLNQALVYREQLASQAGFEADLRAGPGLLIAYAVAAGGKPLADVKAALLAEVMRLATHGATPAELAKIKTQVLTQALLARQTPQGLASAVAEAAVLEGNPDQVNQGLADLQRVTIADVKRVLQKYVVSANRVAIEYTQEGAVK
jgi:zinc protease